MELVQLFKLKSERWNSYLIIVFSKNNFANYLYW